MSDTRIPLFDVDRTAQELASQLELHRRRVAAKVGTPADGPMFRAAGDGSIIGPGGRVVQPAPKVTQPTGG